ncbi:hypothetical protein AGMMS49975_27500 [Clostridia bacterium]|nr:hypothetical protein AGMMS49975_27500 [Clostridia bacterium]
MGQKFKNLADLGRVKGFSGAEGKVRFDFTDALTGKVKNRVEDGNMVFSEQLRSTNIISFLSQLVTPIVYLTDGEDEPTDDFQLLPGSIVGWGSPMNGSIAGAYQGAFNAPASKIGVIPPTKDRCVYKYVYDFLPTQLPLAPKAVGITQQFMSLYNYNTPNYFEANAAYTNNAFNYVYDAQSGLGYAISNAGVVTVYNPLDGTSSTIDVSAVVGAVSALSVGINQQNGMSYTIKDGLQIVKQKCLNSCGTSGRTLNKSACTSRFPPCTRPHERSSQCTKLHIPLSEIFKFRTFGGENYSSRQICAV